MALTAANASTPATMSFGLCSKIRMAKPRSAPAATALARRRRRRGISSSSLAICLGTSLHLVSWVLGCGSRGRSERCDIARWFERWRKRKRPRDGHAGSFVDPALHSYLTAMQPDQAFHDRQAKTGALVAPLIRRASLKEGIADPLEIVGRDANAGITDAKQQPRSLDCGGYCHLAAALGKLDGVGYQIQHDLFEGARIAGHDRQIFGDADHQIDAVFARLDRQQVAAIDERR